MLIVVVVVVVVVVVAVVAVVAVAVVVVVAVAVVEVANDSQLGTKPLLFFVSCSFLLFVSKFSCSLIPEWPNLFHFLLLPSSSCRAD